MSCKPALLLVCSLAGCSNLGGEVDGQKFTRCAQTKVAARTYRAGALTLTVQERTLKVEGASGIAAFTGPVGRSFRSEDVNLLNGDELAVWIGGLGDTPELARENLARVAARRVPTLFIAGGADRWPIVEAAFEALPEDVPIVQGSGLRRVQIGAQHFVIAAGAPRGRYAIDEQGCGLTPEDITTIQSEGGSERAALLSWAAASSPDLASLARALGEAGGLHAFPEPQGPSDVWAVPRLGAPGTQRADGARLPSQVGHFVLGAGGLEARLAHGGAGRLAPRP